MKSTIISAIIAVCIAVLFFAPAIGSRSLVDRKSQEKFTVEQLAAALDSYKAEYGVYPSGKQSVILQALTGSNPKGIVYFEARRREVNAGGELIDRWGTPYRIEFTEQGTPHVSSAGKNKSFQTRVEGSDDISSWK